MAIQVKHALLALAAAQRIVAHTGFAELFVNGLGQGAGTCVRMRRDPETATSPIINLNSGDLACGKALQSFLIVVRPRC